MRIIKLSEDRVNIRHVALDRVTHINVEIFQTQTEWQVKGSKGYYTVKSVGDRYICNCQGFKFRKKCKHSNLIKESNGQ